MAAFFQRAVAFFLCLWQGLAGFFGYPAPDFPDQTYAEQSVRQQLDIYLPRRRVLGLLYLPVKKGPVDVVLCVHGGGWSSGDKSDQDWRCQGFARRGYAAATMSYRMLDPTLPLEEQEASCAAMLDDIGDAIAALKEKLTAEGYPPRRIALQGGSAGGHLIMMYAYSRYEQSAIPIAFLYADVAPTDFTDPGWLDLPNYGVFGAASLLAGRYLTTEDLLDKAPALQAISPLYFVKPGVPPTLMRYGMLDDLIPFSQGPRVKAALDAAGVPNDMLVYPDIGHYLGNLDADSERDRLIQFYLDTYFD
jgi:acetyl esterase/lipase